MNSNIEQDEIRAYLLGKLPEEAAQAFDELSVVDADASDLICSVERDLIDAYVGKQLSPDDRLLFEKRYVRSGNYADALKFAGWLNERGSTGVEIVEPAAAEPRTAFWDIFRLPVFRFGFAAAAVLVLGAAAWFLLQDRAGDQLAAGANDAVNAVLPVGNSGEPIATATVDLRAEVATREPSEGNNNSNADRRPAVKPTPARSTPQPVTAIFVFAPAVRSSGMRTLRVAENTDVVELRIGVESLVSRTADIKVLSANGSRVITNVRGVKAAGNTLVVRIPAAKLPPGVYSVAAESGGNTVVEHYFRVAR